MKPSLPFRVVVALPMAVQAQTELFDFATFEPPPALGVQGSAWFAEGRARLTAGGADQRGGVWFATKRFLAGGFETTFEFRLGLGSEGVAFVVQNNVLPALGQGGSGLGYEGVPNSLAIEFDARSSGDLADLAGSHVSVQTRGPLPNTASAGGSLAWAASPAVADGNSHTARVRYVPGTIEVFLDDLGAPLISAAVVLEDLFPLETGQAWFGLVGTGGGEGGGPDLASWSFQLAATELSVVLSSPLEGSSHVTPAVIDLEAVVKGPDPVSQVEFFRGPDLLLSTNQAPFRFSWESVMPGAYTLTAVATDEAGRRVASQPVRVLVYPAEPAIGINFATGSGGSSFALASPHRAGVIPQFHWNNAPMLPDGGGALQNLRNAAGDITEVDVVYDFVARGEDPAIEPELSADHRLMRAAGVSLGATSLSNALIRFQSIPFPIYDVIIYTDGANGGADRVGQFRAPGNSVFVRDAAWTSFAGLYAAGGGSQDLGSGTPAGNYVRINGLTAGTFTLTNSAGSASDGVPLAAVNAVQIIPSIYDRNAPVFLTRGPYLQVGTPRSMKVRWRTNRPVPSRVQYGLNAGNLDRVVSDTAETQEHSLTLADLEPDTRYFYAVGTLETNLARGSNYFFLTSPVAGKPTRVWVLGDSGTANANAAAVRDAFSALNGDRYVDVWLMLGDNAYNSGTDAEYQAAVFNMYTNLLPQTPLWPTIGNHETAQSHTPVSTTPYLSIFELPQNGEAGGLPSGTERYYSFDYGNIHFLCLDSMTNDRTTNGPMAAWLRADLEANTKDWLIAFFHHPPYTKGSHDSDNPNGADFELVEMRENIVPILESFGVDLVLAGHSHCYERSYPLKGHYGYSDDLEEWMILDRGSGDPAEEDGAPYVKVSDGTIYIVDGSSGQATFGSLNHPVHYRSLLELGSVILDIDNHQMVARFLRETGEVQDTFTLVKQTPGPAPGPLRIISFQVQEGQVTLQWTAPPGIRSRVQRTARLGQGGWEDLSGPLSSAGPTQSWTGPHDPGMPTAYYRIVTVE